MKSVILTFSDNFLILAAERIVLKLRVQKEVKGTKIHVQKCHLKMLRGNGDDFFPECFV